MSPRPAVSTNTVNAWAAEALSAASLAITIGVDLWMPAKG
jgi:hypothetical protein